MPTWFWFTISGLLLVVILVNIWPKGKQTPYGGGIDVTEIRRRGRDDWSGWDWANALLAPVAILILLIAIVIYKIQNPR